MPTIANTETLRVNGVMDASGAVSVAFKTSSISADAIASGSGFTRSQLAQEAASVYPVAWSDLRVWDNLTAALPQSAGTDDLAIIEGTFGTDAPTVQTSNAGTGTVTQYARFTFTLPPEYDNQETVALRLRAGMITAISDDTATVDVQCYKEDGDGGVGSDLCATAAQTINSLTKADKDFTITSSGLASGDTLDVRIAVAITDSGTATVIGEISQVAFLLDVRG